MYAKHLRLSDTGLAFRLVRSWLMETENLAGFPGRSQRHYNGTRATGGLSEALFAGLLEVPMGSHTRSCSL